MKRLIITILTAIVLAMQPAIIGSVIVNATPPPADSLGTPTKCDSGNEIPNSRAKTISRDAAVSGKDTAKSDESFGAENLELQSEGHFAGVPLIAATTSNMPTIPKPDLLPGPNTENATQASVQSYFREKALPSFISTIIGIVGVAAFISLLISGVQFLTAYGNEEKVGAAKKTAIYAVSGFLIAILAYAVVSIISSLPISNTTSGTPAATSTSSDASTSDTAPTEYTEDGDAYSNPPTETTDDDLASLFSIPTAYADVEADLGQLLPSTSTLIDQSPNAQGASLPTGDLMSETLPKIIKIIMYAVGTVILIAIVYAGILLVIARGNEEEIKKAQNIIIYGAIGVVIIGVAYAIVYGISQLNI
ncbi:MAG: pilin [Candidatus Gracilibacteria bacterium]